MILYANGDSWTYGGGLEPFITSEEDRSTKVWPHHLGTMLEAKQVVNLAQGCGSNQRVVRKTYDWVLSQSQEVLNNTVAVIQFTELSRYEIYFPRYKDDPDGWIKCKEGVVSPEIHRDDHSSMGINELNQKRLSFHTDIEGVYGIVAYCDALANLFNRYNVKYYFWGNGFVHNNKDLVPQKFIDYLSNNFNWIPNYYAWGYPQISDCDPHPSIEGHRQIAQRIFDYLKITNSV